MCLGVASIALRLSIYKEIAKNVVFDVLSGRNLTRIRLQISPAGIFTSDRVV